MVLFRELTLRLSKTDKPNLHAEVFIFQRFAKSETLLLPFREWEMAIVAAGWRRRQTFFAERSHVPLALEKCRQSSFQISYFDLITWLSFQNKKTGLNVNAH